MWPLGHVCVRARLTHSRFSDISWMNVAHFALCSVTCCATIALTPGGAHCVARFCRPRAALFVAQNGYSCSCMIYLTCRWSMLELLLVRLSLLWMFCSDRSVIVDTDVVAGCCHRPSQYWIKRALSSDVRFPLCGFFREPFSLHMVWVNSMRLRIDFEWITSDFRL